MSNLIDKNQVKKLKTSYRVFSFFICFCSVIALFGVLTFGTQENLVGGLLAALVPLTLLYLCVPIVFTGYPPRTLMWTMGKG